MLPLVFPRCHRASTTIPANARNSRISMFAAARRTRQKTMLHTRRPKYSRKTDGSLTLKTPAADPKQSRTDSAGSPANSPSARHRQFLYLQYHSTPAQAVLALNPESRNSLRPLAAPACTSPRTPGSPLAAESAGTVSPAHHALSPTRARPVVPPLAESSPHAAASPSRASLRHSSPV